MNLDIRNLPQLIDSYLETKSQVQVRHGWNYDQHVKAGVRLSNACDQLADAVENNSREALADEIWAYLNTCAPPNISATVLSVLRDILLGTKPDS